MKKKISPSIMCVNFFELDKYIRNFEENNIDLIHVDIMDGHFVPNFTLGTDFIRILKKKTSIPLDIHLMIENPENKLEWFDFGENDYVSVHCESTAHLHKALFAIKEKGANAVAAINPATSIAAVENVLDILDGVLVMTVNPGFAGQKLVPQTLNKIKALREYLDSKGYNNIEIEVDGNVSFENARLMNEAGANIFVAGTSSIFKRDVLLKDAVSEFEEIFSV